MLQRNMLQMWRHKLFFMIIICNIKNLFRQQTKNSNRFEFFVVVAETNFEEKMFRSKKFNHCDTLKQSLVIATNHGFDAIA